MFAWVTAQRAVGKTRSSTHSSGATARCSLDSAAAKQLDLRARAAGAEESRQIAEERLEDRVKTAQILYSYATPQDEGGEIISPLLSEDRCEYVRNYDGSLLVMATTTVAANSG